MKLLHKKGFGLLEVLLSGVIIITILGALVFLARSAINNAIYLQQRMQATYLAQEAIEGVRQIRDSNYIDKDNTTKWNTLIGLSSDQSINTSGIIYNLTTGLVSNRYRLVSAGTSNNPIDIGGTSFTRNITFELVDKVNLNLAEDSYKVKVVIKWARFTEEKSIVLEELIANSRQQF